MSDVVETLTQSECVRRLYDHDVGRVSVSVGALPVVVPVLYRVDDDGVVFGSPLDPGLAAACDGAVIAFEVDDLSSTSDSYWSVMVVGVAKMLSDKEFRLPLGSGTSTLGRSGRLTGLQLERLSGHQFNVATVCAPSV